MLFGSVADKTTMKLGRNTHHEPSRIGAFRQWLWNWLAGCGQVGEYVTHDLSETCECFNLSGREPGQRRELRDSGGMLAVFSGPRDSVGVVGCVRHRRHPHHSS